MGCVWNYRGGSPMTPLVFHCTLLEREASRDDCHECRLGSACAGIPSRLMFIPQAPVGPTSGPQYPPTIRESARVGVSGQRERNRGVVGTAPRGPHKPEDLVRLQAPRPSVRRSGSAGKGVASEMGKRPATICFPTSSVLSPPAAPRARRGEG